MKPILVNQLLLADQFIFTPSLTPTLRRQLPLPGPEVMLESASLSFIKVNFKSLTPWPAWRQPDTEWLVACQCYAYRRNERIDPQLTWASGIY